jgi:hypothetical protein
MAKQRSLRASPERDDQLTRIWRRSRLRTLPLALRGSAPSRWCTSHGTLLELDEF